MTKGDLAQVPRRRLRYPSTRLQLLIRPQARLEECVPSPTLVTLSLSCPTDFYAKSDEIFEYFTGVAEKYGVGKYCKLEHQVTAATWDEENGVWHLKVKGPDGKTFDDQCDILIKCAFSFALLSKSAC